jgi:hypothetical protein
MCAGRRKRNLGQRLLQGNLARSGRGLALSGTTPTASSIPTVEQRTVDATARLRRFNNRIEQAREVAGASGARVTGKRDQVAL